MNRLVYIFVISLVIAISSKANAEIYHWVDSKGKTHYSSDANEGANHASKTFEIKDKFIIPVVTAEEPIPYEQKDKNRLISISSIIIDMPATENEEFEDGGVRVGRITCGRYPVDFYWTEGVADVGTARLGDAIAKVFTEAGYTVENSIDSPPRSGSLELKLKFKDVKMNLCPKKNNKKFKRNEKFKSLLTKNATFIKIEWSLFDPVTRKTLYTHITTGSHNGRSHAFRKNGIDLSLDYAMSVSTKNLLSKPEFHTLIQPGDLAEFIKVFTDNIEIKYLGGDKSDKFNSIVDYLKNNTAIIKTKEGHGSGVLINSEGYILTNAHVIGKETSFQVFFGKNKYSAKLMRKEEIRDVALLKIHDYQGKAKGVKISLEKPKTGDEIYVIGTPLKIELQQTITKGIVSAYRVVSGLPFMQTDAAINPGNSGGPVFDATGELVALTVSGIFTRSGANLSINYLIPIKDVISSLNIKSKGNFDIFEEKLKGKSVADNSKVLLEIIEEWLNEPIVRLF